MGNCLFCRIVKGELPSDKVFENEEILAFHDINPVAPVHVLVIPKKHIASAMEIGEEDRTLVGGIHLAIREVARLTGVAGDGFRIVTNIGRHGQQTVPHLHYHVIGGRQLEWRF
jgi:histidine triad (HIT) family protein